MNIPTEVSARHIHISRKDLDFLFGKNYQLKKIRDLTQPGEFAAAEVLEIENNKKKLKIRIVGPERKNTQVEISMSDAFYLGIKAPLRISGKIKGSPGVWLKNKSKKLFIKQGVIIALRHIHCNQEEAKKYGLKKKAAALISGKRSLIFNNISIRVKKNYKFCLHIDTDEGNSAGISQRGKAKLI